MLTVSCAAYNGSYVSPFTCPYPLTGVNCTQTMADTCGLSINVFTTYNVIIASFTLLLSIHRLIMVYHKTANKMINKQQEGNLSYFKMVHTKLVLISLGIILYSLSPENCRNWPIPLFLLNLIRDLRSSLISSLLTDTFCHWMQLMHTTSLSMTNLKNTLNIVRHVSNFFLFCAGVIGGLECVLVPSELKYVGAISAKMKIAKYSIFIVILTCFTTAFLIVSHQILKVQNKVIHANSNLHSKQEEGTLKNNRINESNKAFEEISPLEAKHTVKRKDGSFMSTNGVIDLPKYNNAKRKDGSFVSTTGAIDGSSPSVGDNMNNILKKVHSTQVVLSPTNKTSFMRVSHDFTEQVASRISSNITTLTKQVTKAKDIVADAVLSDASKRAFNNTLFRRSIYASFLAYSWVLFAVYLVYSLHGVCYIYEYNADSLWFDVTTEIECLVLIVCLRIIKPYSEKHS